MEIIWLRDALLDVKRITDYIKIRNPSGALKVRARMRAAVEHLEQFPHAGRTGHRPGTREIALTEYPYIIRYRLKANQVQVLRVFHTSTSWIDL